MNRKKIKEIVKFSLYKDIQNKWFVIFNIITLISVIIIMNLSSISSMLKIDKEDKIFNIDIIDSENLIYDTFAENINKSSEFKISKVTEPKYNKDNIPDNYALVEIIPDEENIFKASITSKEGIKISKYDVITKCIKDGRNSILSKKYNLNTNELETIQQELEIERIMLGVDAENSNTKELIKFIFSAMTYFIAILIFSKLSNEIAQEKQSKSSEYILTTVSEKEYLFAKIFSNISFIAIQGILLMTYYFVSTLLSKIITLNSTDINLSASLLNNNANADIGVYVLALILYNVLNIILLCIIQATLASKAASVSEAGNTMTLLTTIVIVCYIISASVIDPYSKVNFVLSILSCLPILSEFFIPALIVIGQCKIWHIILSLLLLLVAIPLSFNYCSKSFKNGLLDYTKMKTKIKAYNREDFITKKEIKELGFVVGLAILIIISAQTVTSLISSFTLEPLIGGIFTKTDLSLITQSIIQVVSLGLASIFVLSYCDKSKTIKQTKKTTLRNKTFIIFIAIFLVFSLQLFLTAVLYPPLGLNYDVIDMFDINTNSSLLTKIIAVITIAATPAIFEELFFRKAIIDFTSKYSKNFALVFSALLFGFLHMNLSQGLFAFILGIIMGTIYLYTNDIKLTMLIHFINNGFAVLAMILPETGLIIISLLLLASIIAGLIIFIKLLINKTSREKIEFLCKADISYLSFNKYSYIFLDYIFGISIVLVTLMSILTENILR